MSITDTPGALPQYQYVIEHQIHVTDTARPTRPEYRVQIVSFISPELALALLRPAFATLLSADPAADPPRSDLPMHLNTQIVNAALPRITTHHDFTATLASSPHAAFAATVLPFLKTVTTVTLHVDAFAGCEAALRRGTCAACTLPQLQALRLALLDKDAHITAADLSDIAAGLSSSPCLHSFAIHASVASGGADDDAAAGEFAEALCNVPHLRELELTGAAARPLAAALSCQLSSLTALQDLWIDDKDVSDACVVHLVRAAAALPGLTSLHLDAEGHIELPRERFCSGGRTRQLIAAVACATRLQALSLYGPITESRSVHAWCGLGTELGDHANRFLQLTRLDLVGSVSCNQLLGVAKLLGGMSLLRSLHIETGENNCGGGWPDDPVADFAGALAALTQLTSVGLLGPDIPAAQTAAVLRGLGRRPGVKKLSVVGGEKGTARDLAGMLMSLFPGLEDLTLECDRAVQQLHGCRGYAGLVAQVARLPRLTTLSLVVRGRLSDDGETQMLALGLRRLSQLQELQLCVAVSGVRVLEPLLQLAPIAGGVHEHGSEAAERAGPGTADLRVLDLSLVKVAPGASHDLKLAELQVLAKGMADDVAEPLGLPRLEEVLLAEGAFPAADVLV